VCQVRSLGHFQHRLAQAVRHQKFGVAAGRGRVGHESHQRLAVHAPEFAHHGVVVRFHGLSDIGDGRLQHRTTIRAGIAGLQQHLHHVGQRIVDAQRAELGLCLVDARLLARDGLHQHCRHGQQQQRRQDAELGRHAQVPLLGGDARCAGANLLDHGQCLSQRRSA